MMYVHNYSVSTVQVLM